MSLDSAVAAVTETYVKNALAVILLLAAAAAIGLGIASAPASAQPVHRVPTVVMRALPSQLTAVAAIAAVPRPKPVDPPEPLAGKPAEPKPVEVGPGPVAAQPKPAQPKLAEPKLAEPKPAEPKPAVEPRVGVAAAPVAAKPPAEKKAPPTGVGPTPATGGGGVTDGSISLRASDTADVYIDGRKVGSSPVLGHRVKAGKHKIRFDCYDATGESKPGIVQTVDVTVDGEKDVEYECPPAD